MERGVIVGGVLIAASLALAVILNRSADRESRPAPRDPAAEPQDTSRPMAHRAPDDE